MTREDLAVFENFEAVWQRVQQGDVGPTECVGGLLTELMDGLWVQQQGYLQLGRQAAGDCRKRLCRLAKDTEEWLLRLRVGCFLDTCEIYVPQKKCDFASSPLSNLRKLWKNAEGMTEKLQNLAQGECGVHPNLCKELLCGLELHRKCLERCILELLQ